MEVDSADGVKVTNSSEKRKRTSSSASFEMSDDQIRAVLQTIFRVQLPGCSQSQPNFLKLENPVEGEPNGVKSQTTEKVNNGHNSEEVEQYNDLVCNILFEVMYSMSNGK